MPAVRDVTYEVDGLTMVGSLGVPDEPGPRPAVLIAHVFGFPNPADQRWGN